MLKPLIKYTGGKYREYEKIKQYFPKNFNNYYEPFFGGGGIFFRLHNENLLNGEKHVNDFSNSLMEFYQSVSSVTFEKELIKISDAWDFIREFGEDFFQLYGDKFSNLMLDDKLSNFINLDVKEYIEKTDRDISDIIEDETKILRDKIELLRMCLRKIKRECSTSIEDYADEILEKAKVE